MNALTVGQLIARLQQAADMGFAESIVRFGDGPNAISTAIAREQAILGDTKVTARTKVVILS